MKHDDLIEKLENLETPEIELHGHKQALKMALLSSGRFRERTIMDWAKILAPVTAAVLLIAVMGLFTVYKPGPQPELLGTKVGQWLQFRLLLVLS